MGKINISAGILLSLAIIYCFIPLTTAADISEENESAKNVILLIGDGMGFPQLTAARIDKANENLSEYAQS